MSEMVERVARAMTFAEVELSLAGSLDHLLRESERRAIILRVVENGWRDNLPMARAAIAAMREPTAGMLKAIYFDPEDWDGMETDPRVDWQGMIDAALKDN